MVTSMITIGLNIALILVLPFVMEGVIRRGKAFWGGRKGPRIIQPFYDVLRLLRKGEVVSKTATFVFRMAPTVSLAAIAAAALLVPLAGNRAVISFNGDFIVFAYLLALSRFSIVMAGLDTGSSFEGMGCSREVIFAAFVEPGFFIMMAAFAYLVGAPSFAAIMAGLPETGGLWILNVLAAVGLLIMMLAEGSRVPVDDPATHLELTMIHEVMVLDHGGPALGMIQYGAAIKLFVMGALLLRVTAPFEMANAWADWGLFIAGMLGVAVVVGVVESMMARFRMVFVPTFLVAACMLSAFGVILLLR